MLLETQLEKLDSLWLITPQSRDSSMERIVQLLRHYQGSETVILSRDHEYCLKYPDDFYFGFLEGILVGGEAQDYFELLAVFNEASELFEKGSFEHGRFLAILSLLSHEHLLSDLELVRKGARAAAISTLASMTLLILSGRARFLIEFGSTLTSMEFVKLFTEAVSDRISQLPNGATS